MKLLSIILFLSSAVSFADPAPQKMRLVDALRYCANQGAHLRSAREWAQISVEQGAAGIKNESGSGYQIVETRNLDGKVDLFYFSSSGYRRPAGELGNNVFWSSSVNRTASNFVYVFAGFNGNVGLIQNHPNSFAAVLCASGQ